MVTGSQRDESGICVSILVFDGEPVILDLLASVLRREGYSVIATPHGDEAVNLVSSHCFDLAIADLGLRENDGCSFVRRIREMRPDTPIVAMTAYPAKDIVSFAEEHAEAFLPKPFGISDLLTAVRGVLEPRLDRSPRPATALVSREGAPAPSHTV